MIIKKPIISEKTMELSKINKYVFLVDRQANTCEIKKGIKSIYKVDVESVNVINQKGKVKKSGRGASRRPSSKKAVVTIKKGQTIDVLPK
ncbi:MAG: 50S ribosomal protein L23 [Patescibacteria group bacterium]